MSSTACYLLYATACTIAVWFGLDAEMILVYLVLVVFDNITGMMMSYKIKRKITSRIMKVGILSKFVSLLLPILVGLSARAVGLEEYVGQTVGVMLSVLSVNESLSILENIISIRTGKSIEKSDHITTVVVALQGVYTRLIDKLLNKIEQDIDPTNK